VSIFVVRHGETPLNAARIVQLPETPLSPRGVMQAEQLAERLVSEGVARILASDLRRAVMTAERIQARTRAPLSLDDTLRERDFGAVRGTPYAELPQDIFAPDYVPPGGESWATFHARVARAWDAVRRAAAATDGPLVVVTHGLVCGALVARHLGVAADAAPVRWANCSLTEIAAAPPWTVHRLNCTAHLADGAVDVEPGGAA
jgi:probable phosphoglycerate mutase